MSVFHVDGFVNLNHLENDQLENWLEKANAKDEFDKVVGLVSENADSRDIQRALLDLEERTHKALLDVPGVYRYPKDVRIEVAMSSRNVTLGWHDNGGSSSCYVNNEEHRH